MINSLINYIGRVSPALHLFFVNFAHLMKYSHTFLMLKTLIEFKLRQPGVFPQNYDQYTFGPEINQDPKV